ncbi:hypothetical protein FJZ26_02835 [Candidatus Parvarchaeota archaeon]|nr:hypothetical protein [Candidatus Parvarchaeota archaeon]
MIKQKITDLKVTQNSAVAISLVNKDTEIERLRNKTAYESAKDLTKTANDLIKEADDKGTPDDVAKEKYRQAAELLRLAAEGYKEIAHDRRAEDRMRLHHECIKRVKAIERGERAMAGPIIQVSVEETAMKGQVKKKAWEIKSEEKETIASQ